MALREQAHPTQKRLSESAEAAARAAHFASANDCLFAKTRRPPFDEIVFIIAFVRIGFGAYRS